MKLQLIVHIERETKMMKKKIKINFRTDKYMTKYQRLNLYQWLDSVK